MSAPSRRDLLRSAAGALTVVAATGADAAPRFFFIDAATLADHRAVAGETLDRWLQIGADGIVTVASGKVDLGTGLETALVQIVSDELDVAPERVRIVQGDSRGPDQGGTFGSYSVEFGGVQLRAAAAEARAVLLARAARRLGVPAARLTVRDGQITAPGGARLSYAEVLAKRPFAAAITGRVAPKDPRGYRVVGRSLPRVDLPAKVAGRFRYIHDLRLPGMLHGAVVQPPRYGARVLAVDETSVAGLSDVVRVVHRADFVAVIARSELGAVEAGKKLAVRWSEGTTLPVSGAPLYDAWRSTAPLATTTTFLAGDPDGALSGAAGRLDAEYEWPYHIHGMIGPSCAVADIGPAGGTVYCGSQQGGAVATFVPQLLGLKPGSVTVRYVEAAGSYGRLNNDDAAFEAALLSQIAGAPVRVQWSRSDEHRLSVKSPAMVVGVRGALGDGTLTAFDLAVTTPSHVDFSARLAQQLGFPDGPAALLVSPVNDAYAVAHRRAVVRYLPRSLRRDASMRTLGALGTTFALESFIDEAAAAAGRDPVAFRLVLLGDERAAGVVRQVANRAGWTPRTAPRATAGIARGRGIAYAVYEGSTHAAVVADVEVDLASGRVAAKRLFVAQDCGLAVNPDGVRNQIEGGVVQSTSRALYEEVRWGERDVLSADWNSYPIMRISDVPDVVVDLVNNVPGAKPQGSGEAACSPVAAALANAVFDATGARVRTAPLTPERVLARLRAR